MQTRVATDDDRGRHLDRLVKWVTIVACVALVAALVRDFLRPRKEPPTSRVAAPSTGVSLQRAVLRGDPQASVALIEYTDFQCPVCQRFAHDTLPVLEHEYVDRGCVRVGFVNFPLPIHPLARGAAEAARCAADQNRGWAMHDELFAKGVLDQPRLVDYAAELRLDLNKFSDCLGRHAGGDVAASVADARVLGLTGTPTFFLGRIQANGMLIVSQIIQGARPLDDFEHGLDRLLAPAAPPAAYWVSGSAALAVCASAAWLIGRRRRVQRQPR